MLIVLRVGVAGASVSVEPPCMCERSGAGVETGEATPASGRDAEAVEGAREVRWAGVIRFLECVQALRAGDVRRVSRDAVPSAVAVEGFAVA